MTLKSTEAAPFMAKADEMRRQAVAAGDQSYGAVIVKDGEVVGFGPSRVVTNGDPTAHAEVMALRHAAKTLNNYRLTGAELYVTLEPCAMCAGALLHARIQRLVFGAYDPKAGAVTSVTSLLSMPFPHQVSVSGGVLAEPCAQVLQAFFRRRRREAKQRRALHQP